MKPAIPRRGVLRLGGLVSIGAVVGVLIASCTSTTNSQDAGTPTASATTPTAPKAVQPTVVLVHGAWADASSWNGEITALQKQGYDVRAIANPLEDLTTDSQYVADFVKTISGPVVLVHSYGGSVITNAAAGVPNIKALVLPYPGAPAGAVDLYLKKDIFLHNFGNDLPEDEATRLWATQRAASTHAFETPSKAAAWMTIPSWYFISSGDQIITPTSEKAMAERAHSHITVFDGGSHLTLISHPDAVTAVIDEAIASVH